MHACQPLRLRFLHAQCPSVPLSWYSGQSFLVEKEITPRLIGVPPTNAVLLVLPDARACRMLIGACDPMRRPNRVNRQDAGAAVDGGDERGVGVHHRRR